jgi:hypothetical protein
VIGAPPVFEGGATVIIADASPATAAVIVGAAGVVRAVTVIVPAGELPTAFTAVTLNVAAWPLIRPVTEIGLEVAVKVSPVAVFVTMYRRIADPLSFGAAKEIEALLFPAAASIEVGVSGTLIGIIGLLGNDGKDGPTALVATAVKVYGFPGVSGAIVQEVAGALTTHVAPPGDAVTV